MVKSVPIAAIQMVSGDCMADNLETARRLISVASTKNAQLVLLPENFSGMFSSDAEKLNAAEDFGEGPVQSFLSEMAITCQIWLVGCVYLRHEAKIANSALVFDPSGHCVCRYDKLHLFQFVDEHVAYDETRLFHAGNQVVSFDTPFGNIGLSICYDLRFPELYRSMNKPDLILVPAAFTETTGRAHWETLLKARAIENHCYVLAANQAGQHVNEGKTYGHSMLIDAWGNVIDSYAQGEAVVVGWLDHGRLNQYRNMLPNQHTLFACQLND